jgi:putative membrane protein
MPERAERGLMEPANEQAERTKEVEAMWWPHEGWGWGAWTVMMLGSVAFWGLLIWAVVALVRGADAGSERRADPEQILAERLAAGEIDEDEYRRRLDALRGAAHAGRGGSRE